MANDSVPIWFAQVNTFDAIEWNKNKTKKRQWIDDVVGMH